MGSQRPKHGSTVTMSGGTAYLVTESGAWVRTTARSPQSRKEWRVLSRREAPEGMGKRGFSAAQLGKRYSRRGD